MDESVIERGIDMSNTINELSLCDLRTKRGWLFFLHLGFFGRLY